MDRDRRSTKETVMAGDVRSAFEAIGAEARIATRGTAFEIDVVPEANRELYALTYPWGDTITAEPLDVKPRLRHLVLDVYGERLPIGGRFLCGHDEYHWFVAALQFNQGTQTVRGAMESLKPPEVLRAQKRMGVRHRRHRRTTAAYVRQGEWFFLPRPKLRVNESMVERNGHLVREGGKPHEVEWLSRSEDGEFTFARGEVRHPDHSVLRLDVWHRVVRNNEPSPQEVSTPYFRMAFAD